MAECLWLLVPASLVVHSESPPRTLWSLSESSPNPFRQHRAAKLQGRSVRQSELTGTRLTKNCCSGGGGKGSQQHKKIKRHFPNLRNTIFQGSARQGELTEIHLTKNCYSGGGGNSSRQQNKWNTIFPNLRSTTFQRSVRQGELTETRLPQNCYSGGGGGCCLILLLLVLLVLCCCCSSCLLVTGACCCCRWVLVACGFPYYIASWKDAPSILPYFHSKKQTRKASKQKSIISFPGLRASSWWSRSRRRGGAMGVIEVSLFSTMSQRLVNRNG